MRNTTKRLSMVLAMALGVVLLTGSASAASSLMVQSTTVSGGVVTVSVKNLSMLPKTGTVKVQAVVGNQSVTAIAAVAALGGQTVSVNVAFTGTVSNAGVSLSDDSTPY